MSMRVFVGFGMRDKHGKAVVAAWPKFVPLDMLSDQWAQRNHYQSLIRLDERGGLCPSEMMANIERRAWHRMDENEAAQKLAKLIAERVQP